VFKPFRPVLACMLLLPLSQPTQAAIYMVTAAYDAIDASAGDGACADAGGYCTLRAAVQESNAASGPHIIVLPAGTYTLAIPGDAEHAAATGDLDLRRSITVAGQGADRTIIDAGGIDRAFEAIFAGTVLIKDLTIENGVAGANTPGFGSVRSGGAIATVGDTSTLTMRNVVLRNNQAQSGGAVYNVFSTVVIEDSTLHDNAATTGSGGGIAEGLASYTQLYNVTLSGNRAAQNGGGMATSNNTALFHNVTVTGNVADSDADGSGDGGGVFEGITGPTLHNSLIAGNSDSGGEAPDCAGAVTSNGYNLIGDDSGCTVASATGDQIGTAALPIDPQLQALAVVQSGVPVHAPSPTSPALDAGNPATPDGTGNACLETDARGARRAFAVPCDIGAHESVVFGRTLTVNSLIDRVDAAPGDGSCETAAGNRECTLRAAIQEANALDGIDSIELPAGTITLTLAGAGEDLSASGDLDVTGAVRIVGAGMDLTTIDGGGLDRVFHLSITRRVEMQGMTIRNGAATGSNGGGILLENVGGLDLTEVRVTGNTAQSGAGVYAALWSWMHDGMVNLTRCVISDNISSMQGGGFTNFTFRSSKIVDSTLSGNRAQTGGGLFNSFMSMVLVERSTISGNTAQSGGGIGLQFGSGVVTLVNTTLSGNTATLAGGGIHLAASDRVNLFSTTVTANRAAGTADGGGIQSTGAVRLANSVLAGNLDDDAVAPDCAATLTSLGHNLIGSNAGCTFAAAAGDLVGNAAAPLDPRLDVLSAHGGMLAYHAPLADSPLFDAGNPGSGGASCPDTDQRGVDRRLNAPCDIGAIERRTADLAVTASVTPASVVPGGEIGYVIRAANAGPDIAESVVLTLTPPAGSVYGSAAGAGWACAAANAVITCQGADLPSGSSSDLTLTLVSPGDSGTLAASVHVASQSWDANTLDNSVQLSYVSNAPPTVTGLSALGITGTQEAVAVAGGILVEDADSASLIAASVRIAGGFVPGEDVLVLGVSTGLTVTWDGVNGVLSLSGDASPAAYQAALRGVLYINESGTPTSGDRYFEIVVSDGVFQSDASSMLLTLSVAAAGAGGTDAGGSTDSPVDTPTNSPPVPDGSGETGGGVTSPVDTGAVAGPGFGALFIPRIAVPTPAVQVADAADEPAVPDEPEETGAVPEDAESTVQARTDADDGAESALPLEMDRVARESATDESGQEQARPGRSGSAAGLVGRNPGATALAARHARIAPGGRPAEIDAASIASVEFWEHVAVMREQMAASGPAEADQPKQLMLYTAKTMTVFLFAGVTNWYLKGSALLASLFSSLPLWARFDPLPILALNRRMKRRRQRTQAAAAALEARHSTGITRLLDTPAAAKAACC
jgi:CSLREA domain-containing protein